MTEEAGGEVLAEHDAGVVTLTLNRPDRLNAVNQALYDRLIEELERTDSDPDIRSIVLTGRGRAFCAGADLKAHAEHRPGSEERARYTTSAQRANRMLQMGSKPVVAAVNGHAIGAGLELALSSDFMIVAETAKLRLPEVALGTFIGGGAAYTLSERVGVSKARELIYFGEFFLGAEAAEMGVANRAVPVDDVMTVAGNWARRLADCAPLSVAAAKRLVGPASTMSRDEALEIERVALEEILGTADWQEGIDAFREKRPPRYRGE